MDGEESLNASSIFEEEHDNMHEVAPHPMQFIASIMEEIDDEDDLLDDSDAI